MVSIAAAVAAIERGKEGTRTDSDEDEIPSIPESKIGTATVADIRRGERGEFGGKNGGGPKSKFLLYRVQSRTERKKLLDRAAEKLSSIEERSLPPHGGRRWKCDVVLGEADGCTRRTAQPLFRWRSGSLELASLPHLLEETPETRWAVSGDSDSDDDIEEPSDLSAYAHRAASDLTVERIWTSPQHVVHRRRASAVEETEELDRVDGIISRVLDGVGARGRFLAPTRPSKKAAMEAGVARFERDGLWVVGQEESWQDYNQQEIARRKVAKGKMKGSGSTGKDPEGKKRLGEPCRVYSRTTADCNRGKCTGYDAETGKYRVEFGSCPPEDVDIDSSTIIWSRSRVVRASSRHCLSPAQISSCLEASTDHYRKVMHTVAARALHSELADGFDVLRERGRGRYDMELPVFDSPEFQFLTDDGAPWCDIVRAVLGEDVHLVHKGVFMSFPGAETQVYHQDGPHLSYKRQKPCHAVNVFIPLVDLTDKNGPTEFSPGTHILGHENYAKELIETHLVPKGTPIIFDYRLGHRGLGNTSKDIRPILYLTYGHRTFRDSVNFSRRRYHKIGDIIDLPPSRSERAKRKELERDQRSKKLEAKKLKAVVQNDGSL